MLWDLEILFCYEHSFVLLHCIPFLWQIKHVCNVCHTLHACDAFLNKTISAVAGVSVCKFISLHYPHQISCLIIRILARKMIIHNNLSKMKNKFSQPVCREIVETELLGEFNNDCHMDCLAPRGVRMYSLLIFHFSMGGVVFLYHPCANRTYVDGLRRLAKLCLRRYVLTPYERLDKGQY